MNLITRLFVIAAWVLAAPFCFATISVGAHTEAADATTNTTTTPAVTTAASGSTFVVAILFPNGDTVTSVTDSKSNTYTLIQQVADAGDGFKVAIYYCQNGVGGASHTASLQISSTDPKAVYFTEILGGATTGILDQNSGALDTATPFDSPVTTTQANELVYTILGSSGTTATVTWNGGFTGLDSDVSGTITGSANATRVVSSTGTYSPAATTSTGGNAVVITASFIAAGATGVPPSQFFFGSMIPLPPPALAEWKSPVVLSAGRRVTRREMRPT